MKLLLLAGALLPQENAAPVRALDPADLAPPAVAEDEAAPEEVPAADPWDGTFAQGMAEVVRLAASDEAADALALTDRLLAPDGYQRWRADLEEDGGVLARAVAAADGPLTWLGLERLPARDRAEVRFARGLLRASQDAVLDADRELDLARADAGHGALREAAVYALGALDLAVAEDLYQALPEVSGAPPTPPGPPAPGGEEEPDPLELARAAYLAARAHFVERLRLDWQDDDTRANVELCVRRLRHLDELEEQREQEQEQEPQESDDSQESDQEQESEEQQEQDEPGEEDDQEPPDDGQVPEEPAEPDEQQAQEEQQMEEAVLTEEQMKQLLQVLRRHQEAGDELEEQLRGSRRGHVERDW